MSDLTPRVSSGALRQLGSTFEDHARQRAVVFFQCEQLPALNRRERGVARGLSFIPCRSGSKICSRHVPHDLPRPQAQNSPIGPRKLAQSASGSLPTPRRPDLAQDARSAGFTAPGSRFVCKSRATLAPTAAGIALRPIATRMVATCPRRAAYLESRIASLAPERRSARSTTPGCL